MLVEAVLAAVVLVGLVTPEEVLGWLTGDGAWFASAYRLAGVLWVVVLLAVTGRLATGARWHLSALLGLLIAAVYGLPIGLLIRRWREGLCGPAPAASGCCEEAGSRR